MRACNNAAPNLEERGNTFKDESAILNHGSYFLSSHLIIHMKTFLDPTLLKQILSLNLAQRLLNPVPPILATFISDSPAHW